MSRSEILERAIMHYGAQSQMTVAMEELAELTQAISKLLRGQDHNVPEEIADVRIMLDQLEMMLGCKADVQEWAFIKLSRLTQRMDTEDAAREEDTDDD